MRNQLTYFERVERTCEYLSKCSERLHCGHAGGYDALGGDAVAGYCERVRDLVLGVDEPKHLDETGVRIRMHSQWLHVLSTRWLVVQLHERTAGPPAREPARLADPRSLEALGRQQISSPPVPAGCSQTATSDTSRN